MATLQNGVGSGEAHHLQIRDDGCLTTTHGDGILTAVFEKYGDYPDSEIKETEVVPFHPDEVDMKDYEIGTIAKAKCKIYAFPFSRLEKID